MAAIEETEFLPPSFQILPKLLLILDDPDFNNDALADIIRVDAGLTADLLRIANTAYFSRGQRIESIHAAILRLGSRQIYRIMMEVVAAPVLKNPVKCYGNQTTDLWHHSLAAALAAQNLAMANGDDPEVMFTLGLLHDLGKIVLSQRTPEAYARVVETATEKNQPVHEAEMEAFQTDHARIGARLLQRWNFPHKIVSGVEFHHAPSAAQEASKWAAYAWFGNIVAYLVDQRCTLPEYVQTPDQAVLQMLHVNEAELKIHQERVLQVLQRELEAFQ